MGKLNILQRVDILEAELSNLKEFLAKELGRMKNALDTNSAVLNGVTGILGPNEVRAKMDENQAASLEAASARQAAVVAEKVKDGTLTQVFGPSSDISFVVTTQTDPEGKIIPPSKLYLPLKNYPPEIAEALRGKSVGDSTTVDGHKVEIVDMYDMVLPAATAPVVA